MAQLFINILITSSVYLLISISFCIIYYPAKFFNLSHGSIITFGAYFTYMFHEQLHLPAYISIIFAIILAAFIGSITYKVIYKNFNKSKFSSFIMLVSSLGMYIIYENLISLLWGSDTKVLNLYSVQPGVNMFGAYITNAQILIIFSALTLLLGYYALQKTKLGRSIRSISSNEGLSNIFGINSNRVVLIAFLMGSAIAAISGILIGIESNFSPNLGFGILLYGIVVIIIGGNNNIIGVVGGAVLLATAQHVGVYVWGGKWMDAIAFIFLILFLVWKPLGFSGKQLKKVEI